MQKQPLIGVPWKSLFLNCEKIKADNFKVLEKSSYEVPVVDFIYFLGTPFWVTLLSGSFWLWQIFGLKYAEIKGFKIWYQRVKRTKKYNQGKNNGTATLASPFHPQFNVEWI